MASILELTDRLLAATGHGPLPDFISDLTDKGGDSASIQIDLFKATGQMYDRRTVSRWMVLYGP